jgi:hypothetical protein
MSESDSIKKISDDSSSELTTAIPTANVGPSRVGFSDILRGSYMWLVALICLGVAIGVAWWSMPEQGIEITIHFPEGHGLAAEDPVKFRGIDVGIVEEVKLNSELSGVDVHVNLSPFGEPLAREGTRFWIVRPQLSLGGVSGLETAVGHKYIGLIPGDPEGEWKSVFDGLVSAPADALENNGIEILLRGEKRNSVNAGSPVTYRGVEIGRVLSVELSPDGIKVDARLRIFDKFTKLVTSESKFWASSGIDADFSPISGLRFEMESLETLVRGGVSMLTVANGGLPIKPGDDFVLYPSPNNDWFEKAQQVQATDVDRRGAIPMEVVWEQKGFLGRQSQRRSPIIGTHVKLDGKDLMLFPSDALVLPEKGIAETLFVSVKALPDAKVKISEKVSEQSLTKLELNSLDNVAFPKSISSSEMRTPSKPESCLAVRANGELDDLRYLSISIEEKDIDEKWVIASFNGDRSVWHGAPVLSETDGKLIGILLVGESVTRIEVVNKSQLNGVGGE